MSVRRAAIACGLLIGAVGCARARAAADAVSPAGTVQVWLTTADSSKLFSRESDVASGGDKTSSDVRIAIDTTLHYQTMAGFGAALSDASAWLLAQRMSPAQRDTLLREIFGGGGLSLSLTRLTIGSSDFSRSHYTYDDVAAGVRDSALAHFSLAPSEGDVLPIVRRARVLNPNLLIFAAPWSAPAWMKSTGSLVRGTLREDAFGQYAEYLARYAEEMRRAGVPIHAMSLQNEPHFEPADYPGMRLTPTQRATLFRAYVGPLFAQRRIPTQLLEWDHNWDDTTAALTVLADSGARRYVAGVAWHCYGGDVSAQSVVHDAYPEKDAWFTECAGGEWAPKFGDNLLWNARTLIVGATRNWARGVIYWNLALDEKHGPHTGGCGDCRGVITIDSRDGRVTRNVEYYVLAHASRFVRAGFQRVSSSSGAGDVDNVVFHDPRSGTFVAIVVNGAERARDVAFSGAGAEFTYRMPARGVATLRWRARYRPSHKWATASGRRSAPARRRPFMRWLLGLRLVERVALLERLFVYERELCA